MQIGRRLLCAGAYVAGAQTTYTFNTAGAMGVLTNYSGASVLINIILGRLKTMGSMYTMQINTEIGVHAFRFMVE